VPIAVYDGSEWWNRWPWAAEGDEVRALPVPATLARIPPEWLPPGLSLPATWTLQRERARSSPYASAIGSAIWLEPHGHDCPPDEHPGTPDRRSSNCAGSCGGDDRCCHRRHRASGTSRSAIQVRIGPGLRATSRPAPAPRRRRGRALEEDGYDFGIFDPVRGDFVMVKGGWGTAAMLPSMPHQRHGNSPIRLPARADRSSPMRAVRGAPAIR
jgi:hypothetical protein